MQQSGHNLGHSKHRQAFGHKFPKHGLTKLLMQRDSNTLWDERRRIKDAQKPELFSSLRELFEKGKR